MRKLDNNRVEGFLRKHSFLKKWVAVMLVVALLVTAATMYSLNKAASAVSEETAEDVGMVLTPSEETENLETNSEEITETQDTTTEGTDLTENNSGDSSSAEEAQETAETPESEVAEAETAEDPSTENAETVTTEDDNTTVADNDAVAEEDKTAETENASSEEKTSEEESTEEKSLEGTDTEDVVTENTSSEAGTSADETEGQPTATEGETEGTLAETEEAATEESTDKSAEAAESTEDNEVALTENVVLTVSYVDEENNAIADEREISLSESLDFSTEAPKQDGYKFKQAAIDGNVISKIFARKDANDFKYYEVTLENNNSEEAQTLTVKENKTVVLTYEKEIIANSEIKLTAKYVDKAGAEIKETSELNLSQETVFKKDNAEAIEGFFFTGVTYDNKKVTKIVPVIAESAETEETNEENSENADNVVEIKGYDISTSEGEVISVNEDTELTFIYVKAAEQKEFSFTDEKVIVSAETTAENVFPEGIEFKVTEITAETQNYNYNAYMDALNDNAEDIAKDAGQTEAGSYTDTNTILYDIAFMYEGQEVQPAEGSVNVSIKFNDNQLTNELAASEKEDIAVVHLPIKEEVKETNDITSTEEATEITSVDIEVKTLSEATVEVEGEEKVEFSEDNFSIFAVISYQKHVAGEDTFESVLGDAVNFGIVTDELTVKESQTNFATKKLNGSDQFGNDLTNNAEQTFIASRISGTFQLKGFPAYFLTDKAYTGNIKVKETGVDKVKLDTAYSSAQLDKIVEDMLQYTRDASADLADGQTRDLIKKPLKKDTKDSDKNVIDTRNMASGTLYFVLDKDDMESIKGAEKLRIYKRSDQRIVFNVTAGGTVDLYKYGISNDGGKLVYTDELFNQTGDTVARSIIWNFINAETVNAEGSVAGVFISGQRNATWNHKATSSGWLAFPKVNVLSGEWHNTYDKITKISGTAEFQAYKNIDDQEATVSGFKFTLYKKDSSVEGGWKAIETVTNDKDAPHNVIFSAITYGDNKTVTSANYQFTDKDASFIYKIAETQGYTDENHNSYSADRTLYYAKVDVKKETLNEYTKTTYYRVSTPSYYTDENCTIPYTNSETNGLPVFNNTTGGSTGFVLHKYLNNQDPGDKKFKFTVKVLNPYKTSHRDSGAGEFETLTESLENIGSDITFNWDYTSDYLFDGDVYFVVTENDVEDRNINKDNDVIVIRVKAVGTKDEQSLYYKFDYENDQDKQLIEGLETSRAKASYIWDTMTKATCHNHLMANADERAFYNKGKTMLRIHKMVVNEFGSKLVRDGTNDEDPFSDAILSNVVFRITNQDNGDYYVFQGFTSDNHKENRYIADRATGKHSNGTVIGTYPVVYNQKAQWTILNLPEGSYTVEEVADGYTLGYDWEHNTSYLMEEQQLSRVTKYDVTEDAERPGSLDYGEGGSNYRVVFSADLANHNDDPPQGVVVGGAIKTVQVCNYYSKPLAPLKVSKNFAGSAWTSGMNFEFTLTPISYKAFDTAHNEVTYKNGQPMPDNSTVKVNGTGATINADGSYSKVVDFGQIPYRFEGEYYYKITENNNNLAGVEYDTKEIYIKVDVVKKETRMHKRYNSVTNPRDYTDDGAERNDENFFYLAADVSYYSDNSFSEGALIARCTQRLGNNLATGDIIKSEYQQEYTFAERKSQEDIQFNNKSTGKLIVEKKWFDNPDGTKGPDETHLTVSLYRKSSKAKADWEFVQFIELTKDNNWTKTIENLTLSYVESTEENAPVYTYSYCVLEPQEYQQQYTVKYYYTPAGANNRIDASTTNTKWFESYVITPESGKTDLGTVTIENTFVFGNTLPAAGGIGTLPYMLSGALIAIAALGAMLYLKKREE